LSAARCFVHDIGGSPPKPITPEGAVQAVLSTDGKSIAAAFTDHTIKTWQIDRGEPQLVPNLTTDDGGLIAWSEDGKAVFLNKQDGAGSQLKRVEVATGQTTVLRKVAPPDRAGLLGTQITSILDDGKSYGYFYYKQLDTLYLFSGLR